MTGIVYLLTSLLSRLLDGCFLVSAPINMLLTRSAYRKALFWPNIFLGFMVLLLFFMSQISVFSHLILISPGSNASRNSSVFYPTACSYGSFLNRNVQCVTFCIWHRTTDCRSVSLLSVNLNYNSSCSILSFGWCHGTWILYADVSEHCLFHLHR